MHREDVGGQDGLQVVREAFWFVGFRGHDSGIVYQDVETSAVEDLARMLRGGSDAFSVVDVELEVVDSSF